MKNFLKQFLSAALGSVFGFFAALFCLFVILPFAIALIVGSNNYLKPDVPLPQIPTALWMYSLRQVSSRCFNMPG